MAIKFPGDLPLGTTFNVNSSKPLDSRVVVEEIADLTNVNTWLNGSSFVGYLGLTVYVEEDQNIYSLIEISGSTLTWKKQGGAVSGAVTSVNNQTGAVTLNAGDVGAIPASEKSSFALDSALSKVAKSGSYNDLTNTPTIPSINGLASETFVTEAVETATENLAPKSSIPTNLPTPYTLSIGDIVFDGSSAKSVDIAAEVQREQAKDKGHFTLVSDLPSVGNLDGDYAFVGSTLPWAIYDYKVDTWVDSGETFIPASPIQETFVLDRQNKINNAFKSIRYVDLMSETSNYNMTSGKIGIFTPISKTSTSLTFNSDDYACFTSPRISLVVKTIDENYFILMFLQSSSNTLELLENYGNNIDLQDVESTMSLHDTFVGTYGQHLSPWGYKAMGGIVYRNIKELGQFADVPMFGFSAISCATQSDYRDNNIYDLFANKICDIKVNELWKNGGNTGITPLSGAAPPNESGIMNVSSNRETLNWSTNAYTITQAQAGAQITFDFKIPQKISGFVKYNASAVNDSQYNENWTFDGTAKIEILSNSVPLVDEQLTNVSKEKIVYINEATDNITVRITILENKNTRVIFSNFVGYENYSSKIAEIKSDSIVAILGSSNTQYPPANADYIDLVYGDPFNQVVVSPDGQLGGDSYGYYPKELQRLSGCQIDNWGLSGTQTTWGLENIHTIFQHRRYSHIIFSLFGNDLNSGVDVNDVINNIWEMCEYAKGQGATPIILMGYGTAERGQTQTYGKLHDYLMWGIGVQEFSGR